MHSPALLLREVLLQVCSEHWAQLGVSITQRPRTEPATSIDLEPLLLLTMEVARDDPRLFDEVLDWCALNAAVLSPHRLRTLCAGDDDVRMVAALSRWLHLGSARLPSTPGSEDVRPVFPQLGTPAEPDPSFASAGLVRAPIIRSGKSRRPDLIAPSCLGLRLRTVFGTDARSEVARLMLTVGADRVDLQVLHRGAGFSGKRVRDAVMRFADAGLLRTSGVGGRMVVTANIDAWAAWLELPRERLPLDRDWPQLLRACTRLARGLQQLETNTSPYLRASDARQLWSQVEDDLRYAGVHLPAVPFSPGEAYWDAFCAAVETVTTFMSATTR